MLASRAPAAVASPRDIGPAFPSTSENLLQ